MYEYNTHYLGRTTDLHLNITNASLFFLFLFFLFFLLFFFFYGISLTSTEYRISLADLRQSSINMCTLTTHVGILCFTFVTVCRPKIKVKKKEGRKEEMFYLTTHSTHLIYVSIASDIW